MSDEQKVPTKEEILKFINEQIEVKSAQLQLQELNTKLAVNRMKEIKALAIIGQITNPKPQGTPHTVTQEDMDNNPELAENGVKVGDEILIPTESAEQSNK